MVKRVIKQTKGRGLTKVQLKSYAKKAGTIAGVLALLGTVGLAKYLMNRQAPPHSFTLNQGSVAVPFPSRRH